MAGPTLDFTKRIATRAGHDVRVYEVFYPKYMNGCYYEEETEIWWPAQWNMDGSHAGFEKDLKLHNVK